MRAKVVQFAGYLLDGVLDAVVLKLWTGSTYRFEVPFPTFGGFPLQNYNFPFPQISKLGYARQDWNIVLFVFRGGTLHIFDHCNRFWGVPPSRSSNCRALRSFWAPFLGLFGAESRTKTGTFKPNRETSLFWWCWNFTWGVRIILKYFEIPFHTFGGFPIKTVLATDWNKHHARNEKTWLTERMSENKVAHACISTPLTESGFGCHTWLQLLRCTSVYHLKRRCYEITKMAENDTLNGMPLGSPAWKSHF